MSVSRRKKPTDPARPWHDPQELWDRLNQPKSTYEEALAQNQRMMSAPTTEPPAPRKKKSG